VPFDDVVEARRSLAIRYPTDPATWLAPPSTDIRAESS
jgi:hypothetical protein